MSDVVEQAVKALTEKVKDSDFTGLAKFAINGEGAVMIDGSQSPPAVSAGDGDAEVTISADPDVFAEMMQGELDPTGAYMSGKLAIDGDMGLAMKLAQLLA